MRSTGSGGGTVLRYENITITYGGVPAVRDVSFSLRAGEILGIAGESGSGKSTLLKAAMGLLGGGGQVAGGSIWYDRNVCGNGPGFSRNGHGIQRNGPGVLRNEPGVLRKEPGILRNESGILRNESGILNLADLSPKERRAINGAELALVFQDAGSAFCPVRTVEAQLWEAVRAHGRDNSGRNCSGRDSFGRDGSAPPRGRARPSRERRRAFAADAAALFRSMGFQDPERVLRSYPFELSGGMAQRVGIAAAMLARPAVLLADEPTSALDVSVQKQVVEELLSLRRRYGLSMIVVTHNIGVIRAMADRMLVMRGGEIVEAGETARVLSQPESAYTRALLSAVPKLRRGGA